MSRLIVENVRLEVGEPEAEVPARLAQRLGLSPSALGDVAVVRRALDARRKRDIHWSLHVGLELPDPQDRARLLDRGLVKQPQRKVKPIAKR